MLVCFYGEIYLSYLVKEILLGSFNSGLTIVAVRSFNSTFRSLVSGLSLSSRGGTGYSGSLRGNSINFRGNTLTPVTSWSLI